MEKMYKTDEEFKEAIDKYFDEECNISYGKNGKAVFRKPPTVTGLALYLGFADRQSIYDYGNNPDHTCTVKKAISRMVQFAEEQLFSAYVPTGAIFWLKNHGWVDNKNLKHSTIGEDGKEKGLEIVVRRANGEEEKQSDN